MTDKYLSSDLRDDGKIEISDDVIKTIVLTSAKSVEGVMEMHSSLKSSFTEILGVKSNNSKIKIDKNNDELVIDLYIAVEYGKNLIDIAKKVQESIKENINTMTNIKDMIINVYINGIGVNNPEVEK